MEQILDQSKIGELKVLIQKGLIYEDDFIEMYLKMIRDEGFMEYFPEAGRAFAREKIEYLIKESIEHKEILEKINNELQ